MGEGVAAAASVDIEKDYQPGEITQTAGLVSKASVQSQWVNQHSYHRKEFRRKASANIT
jgi:hypothetical protein